jgi:hypothetical protein
MTLTVQERLLKILINISKLMLFWMVFTEELMMIFIRLSRSYVLFPLYGTQHDKLVVLLGKLSDNKTLLVVFRAVSNFLVRIGVCE